MGFFIESLESVELACSFTKMKLLKSVFLKPSYLIGLLCLVVFLPSCQMILRKALGIDREIQFFSFRSEVDAILKPELDSLGIDYVLAYPTKEFMNSMRKNGRYSIFTHYFFNSKGEKLNPDPSKEQCSVNSHKSIIKGVSKLQALPLVADTDTLWPNNVNQLFGSLTHANNQPLNIQNFEFDYCVTFYSWNTFSDKYQRKRLKKLREAIKDTDKVLYVFINGDIICENDISNYYEGEIVSNYCDSITTIKANNP